MFIKYYIRSYRSWKIDDKNYLPEAERRLQQLNDLQRLRLEGCSEKTALEVLDISQATYYRWKARYQQSGKAGLESQTRSPYHRRRPTNEVLILEGDSPQSSYTVSPNCISQLQKKLSELFPLLQWQGLPAIDMMPLEEEKTDSSLKKRKEPYDKNALPPFRDTEIVNLFGGSPSKKIKTEEVGTSVSTSSASDNFSSSSSSSSLSSNSSSSSSLKTTFKNLLPN